MDARRDAGRPGSSEDDDDNDSDRDWAPPTPDPMRASPSKRRKIAVHKFFVGDRVELTLDPLQGVVTKTGSGWVTVKFEWGVDNFRADELTRL